MKITDAQFVMGAMSMAQLPKDGKPEIAMVGRSNVGKSSLINTLLGRKNLARTSNQPGKTRQLNYYRINDLFYFVDLPGYGYAKVSKSEQEKWGKLIEGYLLNREELLMVIQLIDVRHPPAESDIHMYQWLAGKGFEPVIIGTKADKIARGQWQKHLSMIRKNMGVLAHHPVLLFSAESKYGCENVWSMITDRLSEAGFLEENPLLEEDSTPR